MARDKHVVHTFPRKTFIRREAHTGRTPVITASLCANRLPGSISGCRSVGDPARPEELGTEVVSRIVLIFRVLNMLRKNRSTEEMQHDCQARPFGKRLKLHVDR